MKKIYISGPISGMPDRNRQAFSEAQKAIECAGHMAINPLENGLDAESAWLDHMRADVCMLMAADAVIALPGWRDSRGARVEVALAQGIGLPVVALEVGTVANAIWLLNNTDFSWPMVTI